MEKKDYIIGVDIGSSNVVMAVGARNEDGEVSILGVEIQPVTDCVKDGDITNYLELGKAIKTAKSALEKELNCSLQSAYASFSGKSVYCVRYEDYVDINESVGYVTDNELRELNARIQMAVPGGGDDIVDRILLRYRIDDRQDVKNPIGAFGRKLSVTYLFVMAAKHQIDRVNKAMHYAEIKVCGLCVNPTLLPQVLLSDAEREEGVVIVDIGADLTDISIVRGGKLWYFSSLPIGASAINNDLYEFLKIPRKEIEMLKRKHGAAIAEEVESDKSVPVKMAGHAKKQILLRNIAEISEERMRDIARFVLREIKATMFLTKVPCGVVLTGGSVFLENIHRLFAEELQMEVRYGKMLNGIDVESQQKGSSFLQASVVGLLLYGAEHRVCEATPLSGGGTTEKVNPPAQPGVDKPEDTIIPAGEKGAPEKESKPTPTSVEIVTPKPENPQPEKLEDDDNNQEEKNQEDVVIEEKKTPEDEQKKHTENDDKKVPSEKKRGGWLSSFRNWLDEVFESDDEL